MGKQTQESESDRVDRAFNRVLAAETQARELVEACRKQAAATLAAAEERARRIASRADRRVRLAHRIADAGVERALAELLAAPVEAGPMGLQGGALERIDRAIGDLIAEILAPEDRASPGAG